MDLHHLDLQTALKNFQVVHQTATRDRLRMCGENTHEDDVLYSHIEATSGTKYKLAKPMSAHDFEVAYMCSNSLMVVIPDPSLPQLNHDKFYSTARVTEVSFEYGEAAANSGISLQLFIRTQNHKYRAVQVEPVA